MIVLEQLGARIAQLRRERGLTQEMLADKMGVGKLSSQVQHFLEIKSKGER